MVVAAAGAVDHQAIVADVERKFASFAGPQAPAPEAAHFVGGHPHREARPRAGAHWPGHVQGLPQTAIRASTACRCSPNVLGRGMSSRLFQEFASSVGFAIRSMRSTALIPTPEMFGL